MVITQVLPCPQLSEYVRKHEIFRFVFDKSSEPPPKFYVPRAEHCLTFYVREKQKFSLIDSKSIENYPTCVLVGLQNRPIYRYGGYDFWAVKVILQPTAFFRMTKIPAYELTNNFIDAEAIWGNDIRTLSQGLNSMNEINEMIALIEDFLLKTIAQKQTQALPIDKISNSFLQNIDKISLNHMASEACLSRSQFIRKFEERVGLSFKTYSRIVRFEKAFRLKNAASHKDWLTIALELGYYDYQHLVRDFKEFTTLTPNEFLIAEGKSPERTFGAMEV